MAHFKASYHAAPAASRIGDVDPAATVQLTVVLKPGAPLDAATHCGGPGLSREAYLALHGTPEAAIARVRDLAAKYRLTVVEENPGAHIVKLRGTYAQALAAFRPDHIGVYANAAGGSFVARSGHIVVPHEIAGDVVAIMGLDQRPVATTHFRPAAITQTSYTPAQIAAAYHFPTGVDGTGQTIALIELGGGYVDADMAAYFAGAGITRTGTLAAVGVDGAANAPDGNPGGADGEVQLDIEIAGSVAPGASIVVYFGPNQGSGFLDAISAAVNDAKNAPSVVSISWGGPESAYSAQDLNAMDQALAQAAALGITVCAASGDSGSADGVADGANHVDFPASSPNALGCGGTSLPAAGLEIAWNNGAGGGATGGGYSGHFPIPAWQTGVTSAKRGVPDVAGNADPATGYQVSVDGSGTVVGGTSAVAPLWAGLVALINQSVGHKVGFINPALYANPAAFTDIVSGGNGAYNAAAGWDPVTGLGSPVGTLVLAALQIPPATA